MNDALHHCHQKPMYKQTVPCHGYAQSVSTDAGGVKYLLMFIWRKLTCCSLVWSTATLSLWSTIKHCTLAAEVTESCERSLWKRAAEAHRGRTDSTSGRFVTPLKTLSTGMETCSKCGPRASWNVAVRRATVPASWTAKKLRPSSATSPAVADSFLRSCEHWEQQKKRPISMWRGKGHCRKASLVDWPAHCADTRAQRNNIHRVIPDCLLSSHGSGKIRTNHLTQSFAKEDHADPCMACSSLEMKPEQQRRSRSSPTSEHQCLRKLPRRGSEFFEGVKISSWPRTQVRRSQW